MGDRGRKENLGESAPLNLKIPKPLFEDLTGLARSSRYGVTVSEVAAYFLKQAVERVVDRGAPPESPTGDGRSGE